MNDISAMQMDWKLDDWRRKNEWDTGKKIPPE